EKPVTPIEVERTGAWLDTVVVIEEPSADAAVRRMEVGEIDVYAYQVSNPAVASKVAASEALEAYRSFGSYNELTFNTVGPEFADGRLNPFAVPAIREAMNWLVDREYIAEEILGGMGVARWLPFNVASNDYALMADVARKLEFQYAYDKEKAAAVITAEMEKLGAILTDGKWTYKGEPVNLIVLIRTEDERRDIGDYVANQLEDIGLTTTRDYKTSAEASPIWIRSDPAEGKFHVYTGGWITTVVPRNLAGNFAFFYTDMGLPYPLWQAYENAPEFYDLAQRLDTSDYTTLEERKTMMARALELAMIDSNRIFLSDRASITPRRANVTVAADLYGAVSGAWLWPLTIRRVGEVGGSMTIAMPSILPEPWNPLNGSNWIYDMMLIRGTGEVATVPDPYTGLELPQRIERAEVVIKEGLPVGKTHDWVDLTFAPEIVVPDDAWADWDPVAGKFITAGEKYTQTMTVNRKSTVYYPQDLYDTVTWHDGSAFSVGDVVMAMILTFDRAKEESPVYDAAQVPAFESFMSAFRGVRIVSTDPLVIETYSDAYELDAENSVSTWWPYYAQGQGAWHALALGLLAEEKGEFAFSAAKAKEKDTEWASYIAGPSIAILDGKLTEATEAAYIPYAATMGEYVTADEAAARYANLGEWRRTRGHFWVGTGPLYLERAFPVEGTVLLRRNLAYPDDATKWERFGEAAIAEVEVDGPQRVTIGSKATFEVYVDFKGEPYPPADISEVKYLVFDSAGELASVGPATLVEDGLYEIVLDEAMTAQLEAGSNRLEAVVVSKLVAVPSFDAIQFVTAQ
ncbi:MAG: ABC transporter substrate-binding protein, partial [Chloroflexi bacterium]|nr:ABC transporter substrate-binding protein [Chloroflexota bacterium]